MQGIMIDFSQLLAVFAAAEKSTWGDRSGGQHSYMNGKCWYKGGDWKMQSGISNINLEHLRWILKSQS